VKKFVSLILTLSLVLLMGSVCFATEDKNTEGTEIELAEGETAGSQMRTTTNDIYDEEIDDDSVPESQNKETSAKVIEVEDEEPVKADATALPKTGGIPAEIFYSAGALLIVGALILSIKKSPAK